MRRPYLAGGLGIALGLFLIGAAWIISPGRLPRDVTPSPLPIAMLLAGMDLGLLGYLRIGIDDQRHR